MKYFSSENYDAVHPAVMEALWQANQGFEPSYGADKITALSKAIFREAFDSHQLETFFCFNGTGANNFALGALTGKHEAILCSDVSHLYCAESTAPEAFTGCRLYPLRTYAGKIDIDHLKELTEKAVDIHQAPPAVLTLSQPTEYGTIYTLQEWQTISELCRSRGLLLHVDGARLFNALEAGKLSPADFAKISGVDALTLGGTKAGMMFGEAVIFFRPHRFAQLRHHHKRSMQLPSKARFIAAQFNALMTDGLWQKIAGHCNGLARYFAEGLSDNARKAITCPVETNMVFLNMAAAHYERLATEARFYRWNAKNQEIRLAFSFGNTLEEVKAFLSAYHSAGDWSAATVADDTILNQKGRGS